MALDDILNAKSKEQIKAEIREIKKRFEAENVPVVSRHYFVEMANKYRLAHLLSEELKRYKKEVNQHHGSPMRLTTAMEIADFFRVTRRRVTYYLQTRLPTETYLERRRICSQQGTRASIEAVEKSGKRHKVVNRYVAQRQA